MKNFKKTQKKILLTLTLLVSTIIYSQTDKAANYDQGFRLGIGLNAGVPTVESYDFNLGIDARMQYDLTKVYSLTLTTGFSNFFVDGKKNDLGYIPLKAGFKAFVFKDTVYLMGEAGAAFAVTNNYDKTSLVLSPSVGFVTKNFDFSLRYDHFSDFQYVKNNQVKDGLGLLSLRVAYGFKL